MIDPDALTSANDFDQLAASIEQTVEDHVESRLKEVHTAIPALVVSFDPATCTISAQPTIKRLQMSNGQWINIPICPKVPVVWPGGGGMFLTFPVAAGDECLLVFSERAIDGWYQNGKVQIPTDIRMHDFTDAFALVGVNSLPNALANVQTGAAELRTRDRSTYIQMAPGQITIQGNLQINGNIVASGNGTVDGNLTVDGSATVTNDLHANGTSVHTHTHSGVQSGGSNTGVPN